MSSQQTGTRTVANLVGSASAVERRRRSRLRIPVLTVLYHPDVERVGERLELTALAAGHEVALSRHAPGFASPGSTGRQPLADPYLSRTPVLFAPAGEPGGVRLDAAGSRTSVVVDGTPLAGTRDLAAHEVERGVVLEMADRIVLLLHSLPVHTGPATPGFGLVGESAGLTRVREEIARVADLEVPVLLRGETGTGKELVARALHQASRRRQGPWLSVNLGAIPPSLAASELFGAAQGAFTGAVKNQAGYFQRAHGGTLFLDEIGEAPPEVQVALLRVLETGEIHRVGAQEPQRVDVRLIAATDADIEGAIREGRFRAPLLHRLSGYEIVVPPLRERRDDFGRLLIHYLRLELRATGEEGRLLRYSPAEPPWLPSSIVARLARHDWPGNVRELRNVARQLAIDSRGATALEIGPQVEKLLKEAARRAGGGAGTGELGAAAAPPGSPRAPVRRPAATYRRPAEVSEEELLAALRDNGWEIKATAAQLGVSRPSLYLLIDRCSRIRRASDLGQEELVACRESCGGRLDEMAARLEVSQRGLEQRLRQLGIGALPSALEN